MASAGPSAPDLTGQRGAGWHAALHPVPSPSDEERGKAKEVQLTYETPALVEVGDFTGCTLATGTWGWDWQAECWIINC